MVPWNSSTSKSPRGAALASQSTTAFTSCARSLWATRTASAVSTTTKLVQPSVQYKYADERLEKLSAGQKVLIRMGRDNAQVVKAKLRELEAALR